jgi:CheY-specific phosphatase CheX
MNDMRTVDEWLDAAVSSAAELATVALGFDGAAFVGRREAMPADIKSAIIALVTDNVSVQLGIAATEEGCQRLARALLAMEPDEEDLPEEDVADAVGEVANIVAGQVKSVMGAGDATIKIGLPLFISGKIDHSDDVESALADILVGSVPVTLMVLKSPSS